MSSAGDLQSTVLAMRDCAYEVSVALSAFSRVTRGHTALTSECGSMLEEVWRKGVNFMLNELQIDYFCKFTESVKF